MITHLRWILAAAPFALLGGCVAYPYATSFAACDDIAGACYRSCEDYADDDDYGACHADCEYEADRCFADAYQPYGYSGYSSPWYGRNGAWYPESGYVVSLGVIGEYGGPHRDRDWRGRPPGDHRDHRGRPPGDGRDHRGRRGDDHGRPPTGTPPPQQPPTSTPPPTVTPPPPPPPVSQPPSRPNRQAPPRTKDERGNRAERRLPD